MHAKRLSDPIQEVNGRILFLPLKATQIGAVHGRIGRQLLLRDVSQHSDPAQIPRHECPPLHTLRPAS